MRKILQAVSAVFYYGPFVLAMLWHTARTMFKQWRMGLAAQAREAEMNEIVSKLFEGITEGLKLAQVKDAHKYQDEFVGLQKGLIEEKQKGDQRDDAKIENYYKQMGAIAEAAKNEIARAVIAVAKP